MASEVQIFLLQQIMRRTAIGLTSYQLVVIGSNPIRSDKSHSLAQLGLEHKLLKEASCNARLDKLVKSQDFHSCMQEFEPPT